LANIYFFVRILSFLRPKLFALSSDVMVIFYI
jgi:hypothetical protein